MLSSPDTYSCDDEHCGYSPGHPWFYFLGGEPIRPKVILQQTRASGYEGYARADINAANTFSEPRRSEALRQYREKFMIDLRRDLSIYRRCVSELRQTRRNDPHKGKITSCGDVHTNLSLKYCHLVNDFGHLILLDQLLSKQRDLFEL